MWKLTALDPNSTTFRDINKEDQPLYRCKHKCIGLGFYKDKDGLNKYCEFYRPAKIELKDIFKYYSGESLLD